MGNQEKEAVDLSNDRVNKEVKTNIGRDLVLDEQSFNEKYKDLRNELRWLYKFRFFIGIFDKIFHHIENLFLGQRINRTIKAPVFITGDFRSGTTFLEKIVSSHPDFGYFTHISHLFSRSPFISNICLRIVSDPDKEMVVHHQPNLKMKPTWPSEVEAIWKYSKKNCWSKSEINVLDEKYYDPGFEKIFVQSINKHLLTQKKKRFINKNPLNSYRIGYLAKLFPDAKFIHIVRHPYRVLQSQLDNIRLAKRVYKVVSSSPKSFQEFIQDPLLPPRIFLKTERYKEIIEAYKRDEELGTALSIVDFDDVYEQMAMSVNLENRIYRIKYEDLISDFKPKMQEIFNFINLWDQDSQNIIEKEYRKFLDKNLISNKSALPDFREEIRLVLQPLMERYNYS